jgi:hypothetical protein
MRLREYIRTSFVCTWYSMPMYIVVRRDDLRSLVAVVGIRRREYVVRGTGVFTRQARAQ